MPPEDKTPKLPSADDPLLGNSISGLLGCALGTPMANSQDIPDNWEPPAPAHIAVLLPQYQIEHLIGRGGMGAVYKGRQFTLNRPVAIKILPVELSRNTEFVGRFHREAQLLASLSHQGIVTIFDFGQTTEGHLYFVMEYVDGTDLHRLIHKTKLDPAQALRLTVQICEAMQYAHDMGVIHRDIKPANVLVTRDGRAKLADFGLALKPTEHASEVPEPPQPADFDPRDPMGITALRFTKPGTAMGTPDYAAPEVYDGKADARSDIYALGIMLYEMLTGAPPKGYYPMPSTKSKVDVRIDRVVVKALEPDPSARYQKASDMKLAVEQASKPLPAKAPAPPKASQANQPPAQSKPAPRPPARAVSAPPQQKRRNSLSGTATFMIGVLLILGVAIAYDADRDWVVTRSLLGSLGVTSGRTTIQRIEGEAMKVVEVSGGKTETQKMDGFHSSVWSGSSQLLWLQGKKNDTLTLKFPVTEAGRQRVKGVFSVSFDFAVVDVTLDGSKVAGSPFDLQAEEPTISDILDWGVFNLATGEHELKLTLIDTHSPERKGNGSFLAALDYIQLEPPSVKTPPATPGTDLALVARPSASACEWTDHVKNMNSGKETLNRKSNDKSQPRHSWHPRKGGMEWAQYEWETPQAINECRVLWFDDSMINGGCGLPLFWRLLYREASGAWVPVDAVIPTAEDDKWSVVKFEAVRTTALRISVQCREKFSAGICHWKAIAADPDSIADPKLRSHPDLFLGDLSPLHSRVSWGIYHANYMDESARMNGLSLAVEGKPCTQFLWAHANSRIEFSIPEGYTRFKATGIATAPSQSYHGYWKYIIQVDGKTLLETKELHTFPSREVPIDVAIPSGSKRLTLIADDCGEQNHDSAYVAFPTLTSNAASSTVSSPEKPKAESSAAIPALTSRPAMNDPVPGKWWWSNEHQVTFSSNGSFTRTDGASGTWSCEAPGSTAREYLLKFRDATTGRLQMKRDNLELSGFELNSTRTLVTAYRLPDAPSPPADGATPAMEPGFISLFDRDHISGWAHCGAGSMDIVKGNYATSTPTGEREPWGLFWYAERTFSDFILKVDFAVDAPGTNSGVYFRLPKLGNGKPPLIFPDAYEAEIKGETTGCVPGVSMNHKFPLPLRSWNDLEVTAIGQSISVKVNGQTISEFVGDRNTSGYIALQNLGCCGSTYFRNVRIKEINTTPTKASLATDFPKLRSECLGWIAEAKTAASKVTDEQPRLKMIKSVAKAYAKFGDMDEAASIAKSISDVGIRGRAFAEMAVEQAKLGDISGAVTTAQMAPEKVNVDRGLLGIAATEMENGNLQSAQNIAKGIEGAAGKARFLVELALDASRRGDKAAVQQHIDEAKALAANLKEQSEMKDAYRAIVMAQVKAGDVAGAKATVPLYKGHRFGTPLIDVIEAQAKGGDLAGAHDTFNKAGFTMYPACLALSRIADAEADAGRIDHARGSANRLWYSDHKLMAQASVETKAGNLNAARAAADSLLTTEHMDWNRPEIHGRTLAPTAALQAKQEGTEAAYQWAKNLGSPSARCLSLLALAESQLPFLPPPGPRTFTDTSGNKIEAVIIAIKDDEVALRLRGDGKLYVLPMSRFCAQDSAYFKTLLSGVSAPIKK